MNIIEQYQMLASQERWPDALPLIEEIVARAPHIPTSWFNWGVCLDGLGRHAEAATKFREAYALDPSDFGAQFRAFRSFALANDFDQFLAFAREEFADFPEVLRLLTSDPTFACFTARPEFKALSEPPAAPTLAPGQSIRGRLARVFCRERRGSA